MSQKSLAELRTDKMAQDMAFMKKDIESLLRLVAEMHAAMFLEKSNAKNAAKANIKKVCDELVRGNAVPMKMLNGKSAPEVVYSSLTKDGH